MEKFNFSGAQKYCLSICKGDNFLRIIFRIIFLLTLMIVYLLVMF